VSCEVKRKLTSSQNQSRRLLNMNRSPRSIVHIFAVSLTQTATVCGGSHFRAMCGAEGEAGPSHKRPLPTFAQNDTPPDWETISLPQDAILRRCKCLAGLSI
jgi:hypothetical protein